MAQSKAGGAGRERAAIGLLEEVRDEAKRDVKCLCLVQYRRRTLYSASTPVLACFEVRTRANQGKSPCGRLVRSALDSVFTAFPFQNLS